MSDTLRIWRLEADRAELLAKYGAMHQALHDAETRYQVPHTGGDHLWSNTCVKCAADDVIRSVREEVARAVPEPFPPTGVSE